MRIRLSELEIKKKNILLGLNYINDNNTNNTD